MLHVLNGQPRVATKAAKASLQEVPFAVGQIVFSPISQLTFLQSPNIKHLSPSVGLINISELYGPKNQMLFVSVTYMSCFSLFAYLLMGFFYL